MGRRKGRSPEEEKRQAKILELLQLSGVSKMEDIQSLFKETMFVEFMEDGLDVELDEELGYSRYNYRNSGCSPCGYISGYSSRCTAFGMLAFLLILPRPIDLSRLLLLGAAVLMLPVNTLADILLGIPVLAFIQPIYMERPYFSQSQSDSLRIRL